MSFFSCCNADFHVCARYFIWHFEIFLLFCRWLFCFSIWLLQDQRDWFNFWIACFFSFFFFFFMDDIFHGQLCVLLLWSYVLVCLSYELRSSGSCLVPGTLTLSTLVTGFPGTVLGRKCWLIVVFMIGSPVMNAAGFPKKDWARYRHVLSHFPWRIRTLSGRINLWPARCWSSKFQSTSLLDKISLPEMFSYICELPNMKFYNFVFKPRVNVDLLFAHRVSSRPRFNFLLMTIQML